MTGSVIIKVINGLHLSGLFFFTVRLTRRVDSSGRGCVARF